jgi:hypothetical protein
LADVIAEISISGSHSLRHSHVRWVATNYLGKPS